MRDELLKIWRPDIRTMLDLGCRDCWHTAGLPGVMRHTGIDIWPWALERGKHKAAGGGIPGFEPIQADALERLKQFDAGEFDAVVAIDLLEHLEERRGPELLEHMARVTGKLAVVWTTLGYIEQGPYDVDGHYNEFEQHLWGPTPEFFNVRGWQVRSFPGWHGARGGAILAWLSK
jgi:cyclopropane fatty-acyl-phospholipid synthase-like methyltransferase